MAKIVVVCDCYMCPYYDNAYYDYAEWCTELNRHIPLNVPIPDDCPLEDAEDAEAKEECGDG